MSILVTGYEPNNEFLNASELVVLSMQQSPPNEIAGLRSALNYSILPGDTDALAGRLAELVELHRPRICLFVGQAPGRNQLTFERLAVNLRDFRKPDRKGNLPKGKPIVQDGPVGYYSTLPDQEKLVELLNTEGLPTAVSNNGGTHLCNQILYLGLHLAATRQPELLAGFVHIPALPIQVIRHWPEIPFMPMEMTCRALAITIRFLHDRMWL